MQLQDLTLNNGELGEIISEMAQRREQQSFLLKWDATENAWRRWDDKESPKGFSHSVERVTTLTLNVLFDT
jgi:hypothetical protein